MDSFNLHRSLTEHQGTEFKQARLVSLAGHRALCLCARPIAAEESLHLRDKRRVSAVPQLKQVSINCCIRRHH